MLHAENTTPYRPTAEDTLWMLRAVEAEGEPRDLVAAALVSRFMWLRQHAERDTPKGKNGELPNWGELTLSHFVRLYAQPVNSRWFRNGDLFAARLAKETDREKRAALESLATRRETHHSTRSVFSDQTRNAVSRALSEAPSLPDATDYAAAWVPKESPWEARTAAVTGRNRMWARPVSIGWRGYWTDVAAATATGNCALVLVLVLSALWLARNA